MHIYLVQAAFFPQTKNSSGQAQTTENAKPKAPPPPTINYPRLRQSTTNINTNRIDCSTVLCLFPSSNPSSIYLFNREGTLASSYIYIFTPYTRCLPRPPPSKLDSLPANLPTLPLELCDARFLRALFPSHAIFPRTHTRIRASPATRNHANRKLTYRGKRRRRREVNSRQNEVGGEVGNAKGGKPVKGEEEKRKRGTGEWE